MWRHRVLECGEGAIRRDAQVSRPIDGTDAEVIECAGRQPEDILEMVEQKQRVEGCYLPISARQAEFDL